MRDVGGPAALDMDFEFLQVLPLHECKHLIGEACNLLNSEWPRSKTARYQSLFMSCDKFPTSLVLILNDFHVVGHVKLSEITVKGPDIMVESVIISKAHRGKGWGKMLMEDAEEYVRRRGKKMLYLSTRGQEGFYEKLGYEVCKPILYYGVALEPSSDGEIKVNDDPMKTRPDVSTQHGPMECHGVVNGVKSVGYENVNVEHNVLRLKNGVSAHNVRNGVTVRNGVLNDNIHDPDHFNPNAIPPSNQSVISLPPPPPPLPINNLKSRTIFRDIKSSKTYMGKSVRSTSHINFLCKEV